MFINTHKYTADNTGTHILIDITTVMDMNVYIELYKLL